MVWSVASSIWRNIGMDAATFNKEVAAQPWGGKTVLNISLPLLAF
jgi:hypothetical protein